MAYAVLALLILLTAALAWSSGRRGDPARGCCAPADPADDLRMRDLRDDA